MKIKVVVVIKTEKEKDDFQKDVGGRTKKQLEECLHGVSGKFINGFCEVSLTAIKLSIQRKDVQALNVLEEGLQLIGENLETLSLET